MSASSYGGADRHADLAGLGNDDHPQYGMNLSGLFSARPAAGRQGRIYVATDNGLAYYDTGLVWQPLAGGVHAAKVYNSTGPSLTNATQTLLTFDAELQDTDNFHSTTTNTSRLTLPVAGLYLVIGQVRYAVNAAGTRSAFVGLNGGASYPAQASVAAAPSPANDTVVSASGFVWAAAGDYLTLEAYQASGGSLSVVAGASQTFLSVALIGPT